MKKSFSFLLGISIIALFASSCTFAYTQEQRDAYQRAYNYGITTQPTIEQAKMDSPLTRQAFAKMVVNYLENAIGVKQNNFDYCSFTDENKITKDLKTYTKKACSYKIMGTNNSSFKPTDPVDRAQLGTVFSRILWGDKYNVDGKGYYIQHLNALKDYEVMNKINNPKAYAKRGDVMIMFKRIYEKFGSNVYMNNGNQSYSYSTESNNDSIFNNITNSNTEHIYNKNFIESLIKTAEEKGETELSNFLKIELEFFDNSLEEMTDLDENEFAKEFGIDFDNLDTESMTQNEKKEIVSIFEAGVNKLFNEKKDKNNKLIKSLKSVVNKIDNDKFGLKEKYNKIEDYMKTTNSFLDTYEEIMVNLVNFSIMQDGINDEAVEVHIGITQDEETNNEIIGQAFGLMFASLAFQSKTDEYLEYLDERGISTSKTL